MEKWIEIFKGGEYPQGVFSEKDLDQIVRNFEEFYKPPVVIGHPKDNSPAWGWVKALQRKGKKLIAKIGDLVPEFVEFLRKGMYKHVSVKLRKDPEKGWYLVHVGFLGGAEPQVKGLQTVSLQAKEGDVVIEQTFQWEESMKERIEEYVKEFVDKIASIFSQDKEFVRKPPSIDSIPVADPDTKWDAQNARKRIKDAYGWAGLKEYTLVYNPDACETKEDGLPACQDAYKYLVVDLIGGEPKIIPKAVAAALAYAHGARGVKIPQDEAKVVEKKVKKLKDRIQKEFEGQVESFEKEVSMGDKDKKMLTEEEFHKELEARLAEERKKIEAEFRARQEHEQKIHEFLKRNENRIPPVVRGKLESILNALPNEVKFSDGKDEKTLLEGICEVFEAYPDLSYLFKKENGKENGKKKDIPSPVKLPAGVKIDEVSEKIHERALQFMAEKEGLTYEEAVKLALKE